MEKDRVTSCVCGMGYERTEGGSTEAKFLVVGTVVGAGIADLTNGMQKWDV